MRKFLMVAAVVAVAACGKKQGDTGSMEAAGAAAGAAVDTLAHKADSAMGAMTDSAHSAMSAAADSTASALKNTSGDTAASRMDAKKN